MARLFLPHSVVTLLLKLVLRQGSHTLGVTNIFTHSTFFAHIYLLPQDSISHNCFLRPYGHRRVGGKKDWCVTVQEMLWLVASIQKVFAHNRHHMLFGPLNQSASLTCMEWTLLTVYKEEEGRLTVSLVP